MKIVQVVVPNRNFAGIVKFWKIKILTSSPGKVSRTEIFLWEKFKTNRRLGNLNQDMKIRSDYKIAIV